MRILYFAQARLAAGISEESFHTTESLSAEKLWHLLIHRHPASFLCNPPADSAKIATSFNLEKPFIPTTKSPFFHPSLEVE